MIVGLIVFGVLLIVAGACGAGTRRRVNEAEQSRAGSAHAGSRPRKYQVGRAALRAYRTAGDVRAMARGPGAYGRRIARRAVFRSLRKM